MKTMKAKFSSNLLYLLGLALTISIAMLPMVIVSGCDGDGGGRRSEQEPNNTFAECNLVGLSTIRIQGTIDPQGDIDFFCFDIEEPGTMLDIEIDTGDSPLVPFLELFGPDQDPLAEGEVFIEFTADQAGRYFVSVIDAEGQGGSDFSYVSTLTSIPPEPPPPTPTPTASPTPTPTVSPTPTPTVSPTPMPQIHDVSIGDNFFDPEELTINAGDTVRWTNNGNLNHTSTSDNGGDTIGGTWDSSDMFPLPTGMEPGDVFEFTFTEDGTFPYHCRFHGAPGGVGQAGTIFVEP